MFRLLFKYLILNKKASVPGVGVFSIRRKPAKLDFANKIFVAPELLINFKPGSSGTNESIHNFTAKEEKKDEAEEVSNMNDFSNEIQKSLKENNIAELQGLGVISQNAEGKLLFTSTNILKDYFPDVTAERILREHVEHKVLVGDIDKTNVEMKEILVEDRPKYTGEKDNWWIFAIALGVIGIATIVYYYLHNGSLH